ncbi:metallophosphoesterase [Cytophagaceae bacterium ABcell3]|nr:metallophosphoesterase [Cytophagaceae bacterium ABcell3]
METQVWEYFLLVFALISAVVSWYVLTRHKTKRPYYVKAERDWHKRKAAAESHIDYSVFLIGDAGANTRENPEPTLDILRNQLLESGKQSAVFFLGDNIYPKGMVEPEHKLYNEAVESLMSQLHIVDDYLGRVCIISGNHDWNKGRKGGLRAVLRQQDFVDDYFGNESVFLPRNGCPGPTEIKLTEDLTAIIINTQWWVHNGKRPIGKKDGCNINSEEEFFETLKKILDRNKSRKVLVAGHHPMYSKASHGGKFDPKQHIFPLTAIHKKAYVPLPVAGSLYPMYRKFIGAREDISHPLYRRMRKKMLQIFRQYPNLVYAAGHDHNLQYIRKGKQHYIVSGAGSKVTYVTKGKGAAFTHAHKGFFRINYLSTGEVNIEAWEPNIDGSPRLAYRGHIEQSRAARP